MRKIKVLFIIYCYSLGGGAEALLTSIVNNLNPEKYDIGVVEMVHEKVKVEPTNANINIHPFYIEADAPNRKEKLYSVYHEWDKVISEWVPSGYDIYISFNYQRPSFMLPPNQKNISWIHGDVYDLANPEMSEERQLQKFAFAKAKKIVTISDFTYQSVLDLFPECTKKTQVIYNGVDLARIRKKSMVDTEVNLESNSILVIGRLDENKNPLRMLEIFEQVYRADSECHLYYLGDGVLHEQVESRIKHLGIESNVHLLGYYSNPFPIIKQCKIVCMTSKSEGFGLALIEGLCLGKAIVSTKVGVAEMLTYGGKAGVIFDENVEAVEAIINYLHNGYDSNLCIESAMRFGLEPYIDKVEKLIDDTYYGN